LAKLKIKVVLVEKSKTRNIRRKMKRLNNMLFDKICDIENLRNAHINARKGKLHYSEVKMVDANTDFYLSNIQEMLLNDTYKISKYKIKTILDKTKEREIYILPYYPDRIIQWAIMLQIRDRIEKSFILTTYASMPNRGIHKALDKMNYDIRKNKPIYYLKLDIKKFYPNINHEKTKSKVEKLIKCERTLKLIFKIIDSVENGIPIGNYLSQYLGNLYLSDLDHYCKEALKCNMYYRYMDDIVILNSDKNSLHNIFEKIKLFLEEEKLTIKNNYRISNIEKEGIDFLGYRHFGNKIILRKSIKQKLHTMSENNIASFYGWVKFTDCYNLKQKYFRRYHNDTNI
jgi:RNA-directed DNA polymerase